MTNRLHPPSDDLVDVETSWGMMPRWKARALALSEIQSVVREALADTTTKTTAVRTPIKHRPLMRQRP
jgi:hypothetical protein